MKKSNEFFAMKGRGFLRVFLHWPQGTSRSICIPLNEEDPADCQTTDKPHISFVTSQHDSFIPVADITKVTKLGSLHSVESYLGDNYHDEIMINLENANVCNCDPESGPVCNKNNADSPHACILHEYLPFYLVSVPQGNDYVVHPCERERMERILNGTDDPMYDLVHELRYNPYVGIGSELQDARNEFNKRTRGN